MDFYLYLAETNLNKGRKNLKSNLDKIKRKLETVYRDAVEGAVRKEVYLKIQ